MVIHWSCLKGLITPLDISEVEPKNPRFLILILIPVLLIYGLAMILMLSVIIIFLIKAALLSERVVCW